MDLHTPDRALLDELRRFPEFQGVAIDLHTKKVRTPVEPRIFSRALGRPAGRTRFSHFHSNGQPSVAINTTDLAIEALGGVSRAGKLNEKLR